MPLHPIKIAFVFGTQAELIKIRPVILGAKFRGWPVLIHKTLQYSSVAKNKNNKLTNIDNKYCYPRDLTNAINLLTKNMEYFICKERPSLVVGVGDTTSVFSAAIACKNRDIAFAHMEAGMRTWDLVDPWPEEFFRKYVDFISSIHVCFDPHDKQNLKREGIPKAQEIPVFKSTVYDSLFEWAKRHNISENKRQILLHLHRRELPYFEFKALINGISNHLRDNPNIDVILMKNRRYQFCSENFSFPCNVRLRERMMRSNFLFELCKSSIVISDSGGVQEECQYLGIPNIIIRNNTERPYLVDGNISFLVGREIKAALPIVLALIDEHLKNKTKVCIKNRHASDAAEIIDYITYQAQF
ncbi:UDP-N-acetylglucosamine 2-epimerase [Rhodospira trueperi]|uniref:UDP-N-acetylglucosamine 2-epimerase (Non-hydrolysing) n=1 Tax=Rhodospira trueperi TaxID=69960 RepID=A0A1G7HL71_9PROT|nr:UDP-N-acetylglucosamine 2-epimerase [Rhodospira trueperi]SDF01014.1 UDP-N-acetylglucosamine 2-epimerase (non-hydrolysing) [Rhodospira trueperi]